jgi:AcrR family transcriptional regulator
MRYLERNDWETDVARYGIDIWMTTIAIAEGYQVCQSFLGAKLHDAKDPAADLTAMLQQVVGSVFTLMREYEHVWRKVEGSRPVDLFGFRFDVGLDPVPVNLERMTKALLTGYRELREIWSLALEKSNLEALAAVCRQAEQNPRGWRLPDDLWARIVMDFACAHRRMPVERTHLLRSLTPLYLGRVASFVMETETMISSEVEDRIEQLCLAFEAAKPYLLARWNSVGKSRGTAPAQPAPVEVRSMIGTLSRDSGAIPAPAGRDGDRPTFRRCSRRSSFSWLPG